MGVWHTGETKQEQGQLTWVAVKYYKNKTGVLR